MILLNPATAQWRMGEAIPARPKDWLQPFNHEAQLDGVLDRAGLRPLASAVWAIHPHLRLAALRLSRYITPLFPGQRLTLVGEFAARAVTQYYACSPAPHREVGEIGFLRVMADAMDGVMALQAVSTDGHQDVTPVWSVFGEPLPSWLGRVRADVFYLRKAPDMLSHEIIGARLLLMSQFVGHRELGLLTAERDRF